MDAVVQYPLVRCPNSRVTTLYALPQGHQAVGCL